MNQDTREILITSALPYANGEIHLGHLVEYIQSDIWTRFQRLCGHRCYYVCADDAHGTPIMLYARQEGITPEELIARVHKAHTRDFKAFDIGFDNYYTTHSDENYEFSCDIFERLQQHIVKRTIKQAYDEKAGMFLPDRFIRGQCPRCGAEDQYGDCCEVCSATYTADSLINPVSVLSGEAPTERESEHLFFKLSDFEADLKEWVHGSSVQNEISNKINDWFEVGLQDWDISRDAPYFGFKIPGYDDKYFYVWLDAPIGYMASFKDLCNRTGLDFDHFWREDSTAELHHFIGKDIAYFHTLFWPAMLKGAGLRLPNAVRCHGFLTINGKKMSKSRGTFITAQTYLEHLHPDYLRYYFAAHINGSIEDIDLNLDDFKQRVNSDMVGKFINIASRCASFINKHFDDRILCGDELMQHELYRASAHSGEDIALAYDSLDYATAIRKIMALADDANRYIEQHKPWEIAKRDGASAQLHEVCSLGLLLFARLVLYLKPTLPQSCAQCEDFLQCRFESWNDNPFAGKTTHTIKRFTALISRIEESQVAALTNTAG